MKNQSATTFLLFFRAACAIGIAGMLREADIPSGDWVSLDDGSEVLLPPSDQEPKISDVRLLEARNQFLDRLTSGFSTSYESQFIDGSETYYSDYAQAWRLLGFYVDCNAPENQNNNGNQCENIQEGGEGDDLYDDDDDDDINKNNENGQQVPCQRCTYHGRKPVHELL
jgi:hypothetical protein